MGKMLIQTRSGTMMNMDNNVVTKLARAALDRGHEVMVFGYGEGVTAIKDGQDPRRFPNVGKILQDYTQEGMLVTVCETRCYARGIKRGEEFPGSKIGSMTNDLSVFVSDADRMVTIAR